MKLTTVTNVSLDGVTQGHRRILVPTRDEAGVADEDGSGGFERFGWGPPLLDDAASTFISQTFQRANAFLFGRRTYEIDDPDLPHHGSPAVRDVDATAETQS